LINNEIKHVGVLG